MKILVVCQYYYPEPFRVTDICEEIAGRGHDVTVVTGLPNYPMGQIYDGYRCGQKRDEVIHNVHVHRCFTIGRRSGAFFRILNYISYAISSSLYISKLKADYDVVFVNQLSPVIMASAGIVYKKKHGKPLVLYCLDLWPESLVAGDIKHNTLIYHLVYRLSSYVYCTADRILVTSKTFIKYFKDNFGIDDTEYLPQYAEAIFTPEECRKAPNETIDLVFAGNLGIMQSVDTIIRAAALTQDISNLRWHIVGDGSELEYLKRLSQELNTSNVIFHGRKPLEEMPMYYAMADATIVTMKRDPTLSMTLPGKVQTYMAAGKPIIGAIDGEAQRIIEEARCGFCGRAENAEDLSSNAKKFCMLTYETRTAYGKRAEVFYERNFSKEHFFFCLLPHINL